MGNKSPFYQVWDDFNASDFSAFSRFFGRKLAKRTLFKNLQTLYQDSLQVVKGTVSKFDLEGLSKVLISKFQTLIAITWLLGKMWSNESEICPFYAALYSHHSRQSYQVITRKYFIDSSAFIFRENQGHKIAKTIFLKFFPWIRYFCCFFLLNFRVVQRRYVEKIMFLYR